VAMWGECWAAGTPPKLAGKDFHTEIKELIEFFKDTKVNGGPFLTPWNGGSEGGDRRKEEPLFKEKVLKGSLVVESVGSGGLNRGDTPRVERLGLYTGEWTAPWVRAARPKAYFWGDPEFNKGFDDTLNLVAPRRGEGSFMYVTQEKAAPLLRALINKLDLPGQSMRVREHSPPIHGFRPQWMCTVINMILNGMKNMEKRGFQKITLDQSALRAEIEKCVAARASCTPEPGEEEELIEWDVSKHGKGTVVVLNSNKRRGVSITDQLSDGKIKFRFEDDETANLYEIHTDGVLAVPQSWTWGKEDVGTYDRREIPHIDQYF